MAVAERVSQRVQVAKLQLQAEDAEARLRQSYVALGQALYDFRSARPADGLQLERVQPLYETIRSEQRALQSVRDRLASRYDDILVMPLISLQEDLQAAGGTVERVTISPASQADGRLLSDVSLPESVRIVLVRRGDAILFPLPQLVLKAGDQVTVIGNRSSVPVALQALRS